MRIIYQGVFKVLTLLGFLIGQQNWEVICRAISRSENSGGGGASSNVVGTPWVGTMSPPIEILIGLTDLPKQPPSCDSPDIIMYSEIANEG